MIKREICVIEGLIKKTQQELEVIGTLPNAALICQYKSPDNIYYYSQRQNNGKRERQPLGKSDSEIVKQYKKRRFYKEMLKTLKYDLRVLTNTLEKLKDYSPSAIHKKLPSSYKNLPDQCYEDEEYLKMKKWAEEKYERNTFPIPSQPNIARDGRAMRSKGECMWYDDILFEKLPVRVDPILHLTGKSGRTYTLCPDFQFMCPDGSFILVEHFGMLDDDNYAAEKLKRIQQYLDCGYVLGDNLIITSDSANHTTNELMILEAIDKIKKRIFSYK